MRPVSDVAELVGVAAGAEAGHRGEERERGDDAAEHGAERRPADEVRDRGGGEEPEPDHVREPRRPAVLERPLAEPRLQHLEVEDAREAPAPPEREAERELQREERQQQPPAGQHGDERDDADDRLVHARRARVDHLRVAVGVGSPLHFGE